MGTSLFLPAKLDIAVQHSLTTTKIWSWVAPDANNDSSNFDVEFELWGSGSSGGSGAFRWSGGSGAGSGAHLTATFSATPGTTYNLRVGQGGALNPTHVGSGQSGVTGNQGESSYVFSGSTYHLVAGSGLPGVGGADSAGPFSGGLGATCSQSGGGITNYVAHPGAQGGSGGKYNTHMPTAGTSIYGFSGGAPGSSPGATGNSSGGGSASNYTNNGHRGGHGDLVSPYDNCAAGGASSPGFFSGGDGFDTNNTLWQGTGSPAGGDGKLILSYTLIGGASDSPPV